MWPFLDIVGPHPFYKLKNDQYPIFLLATHPIKPRNASLLAKLLQLQPRLLAEVLGWLPSNTSISVEATRAVGLQRVRDPNPIFFLVVSE